MTILNFGLVELIFFLLKTKLHEEECQKRTLATIATHDLAHVKDKLLYEAADPTKIEVCFFLISCKCFFEYSCGLN